MSVGSQKTHFNQIQIRLTMLALAPIGQHPPLSPLPHYIVNHVWKENWKLKEYYEKFWYALDMHFHHICFKIIIIKIIQSKQWIIVFCSSKTVKMNAILYIK